MTMLCFDPIVDPSFGFDASLSDVSGQRLMVSDRYADLLKRSKDDLLRQPWQTIAHPDDLKELAVPYNRLVAEGVRYEHRCRVLRGDGVWLPLTFRASKSVDEQKGRILVQSRVRMPDEPVEEPAKGAVADAASLVEYIRELTRELGHLAGQRKLDLLHHFLAMASAEAGQELDRLSEKKTLFERIHRSIH